jgi:hypothetical protein
VNAAVTMFFNKKWMNSKHLCMLVKIYDKKDASEVIITNTLSNKKNIGGYAMEAVDRVTIHSREMWNG